MNSSPSKAVHFLDGTLWPHEGELMTLVAVHADETPRKVTLRNNRNGELITTELLAGISARASWTRDHSLRPSDTATGLDLLKPKNRDKAIERARHVREILCGNPTGDLYDPRTCNPRYDPARYSEEDRTRHKIEDLRGERGYSRSNIYNMIEQYRDARGDITALAPGGIPVPRDPRQGLDPAVVDAIAAITADLNSEDFSIMNKASKLVHLKMRLREAGLDAPILTAHRLEKLLDFFQNGIPQDNAEHRRNKASRTVSFAPRPKPTQFLERVEVDATRLNIAVYDPDTGKEFHPWVVVAICCTTKLITARLCPKQPNTRDVKLLLFDMMRPVVLPDRRRDHMLMIGVPKSLAIRSTNDLGVVVIDNGQEMINVSTLELALKFGIDIEGCRTATGSDKGFVESANRSLDHLQQLFPGYAGSRPQKRGKKVSAVLSYGAVDMILQEYIHTIYPHLPHTGLPEHAHSKKLRSPAAAFTECLLRGGVSEAGVHPDDVFSLLENHVVAVNSDGVRRDGIRYRGEALRYVVREDDPTSKYASSIRIFFDPADLSRVFFYSTDRERWCELQAIHANGEALPPCSDIIMPSFVEHLARNRLSNQESLDVKVAFVEFINRIIDEEPLTWAHDRAYLQAAVPSPQGTAGATYEFGEAGKPNQDFPLDTRDHSVDDSPYLDAINGGREF